MWSLGTGHGGSGVTGDGLDSAEFGLINFGSKEKLSD